MPEINEHLERLQAMADDSGETWDLSENDQAAIRWALESLAVASHVPQAPTRPTCPTCGHYPWKFGTFPSGEDCCGFHACGCKHECHAVESQVPTPELEIEREADGRWLAEFTRFPGVMAYGGTEEEAVVNAAKVLVESQAPSLPACPICGSTERSNLLGKCLEMKQKLHAMHDFHAQATPSKPRMMGSYPGLPSDEPHVESPDCRGQGCIPLETLKPAVESQAPSQPAPDKSTCVHCGHPIEVRCGEWRHVMYFGAYCRKPAEPIGESSRSVQEPQATPDSGNYVCDDAVFPQTATFSNGRVVTIASRPDGLGSYLKIFPKSEYPKPCGICSEVIQSKDDLDWHGYGNCRDIPEAIMKACTKCGHSQALHSSSGCQGHFSTGTLVSVERRGEYCTCDGFKEFAEAGPAAEPQGAANWLASRGLADLSLYWPTNKPIPQIDYESGEAQPTLTALLEAYSASQTAALREENERLSDWKESAIACTPDMQKIGHLLGLRWGQSVHDKIVPGIEALKERAEKAEQLVSQLEAALKHEKSRVMIGGDVYESNRNQHILHLKTEQEYLIRAEQAEARVLALEVALAGKE